MLKIVSQKLTGVFFPSDVIRCKKDRSSGAQQCPVCASPQNYKGRNFVTVPSASLTCTKPVIHHSLKFRNLTVPDDGDFSSVSTKEFIAPIGSMVLNMTDQAGNRGNLVCNIQKPKEMSPLSFDKDGNNTILKTSFTAFLVCDIAYEHIQQLWSILALYSNFPLKLERNALATKMPFTAYHYKQIYSEKDELYTNVEAELRAEPPWLMQSKVALQLDRTATTLNTLHIQYFTDAQIILPSPDQKKVRNNWTIISRDNKTQTQHTVLVGGTVELDCQAIGDPAPAIEWILADGSKVRAPYISEDGRIIVVKTGTFTLRTADTFDTGLYHCIGTNYNDADILAFRITVVDPYVEHSSVNGAHLSASVGSTLYLPCTSAAVPDAAISWVLPKRVILHHSVRNKHIFDNGTLRIQGVTEQDSGYFRCVAANQYGVDLLVLQVLVRKDKNTPQKMHVAVGEWEESDGSGNAMLASARRHTNPSATLAPLIANEESAAPASRNQVTQSAYKRHSYGKPSYRHYRDKMGRRFRGQRRQFVSSARRVDPQRWAAFLEKTKRNSTLVENQEVEIKPAIQGRQLSKAPVEEEETSGDLSSPEQEFMIPVTESATVSPLGKATPSVVTAGPSMPTSNSPAGTASLLAAEAVAPLPSPSSQSVSSDSRRPQTYLKPTITNSNSWEIPALSQISANVKKQSTQQRLVSPGESPSQQLNPVSSTPMADVTDTSKPVNSENTVGKLHVFTESTNKISTKTDHQISAATVSEPNPETGHVYLHSTQKPVITKLPLGSNTITHQKIQIIQDVTTHAPQQQYGRRRKISGRRKIVRPGRIPNMKEYRYHFGKQDSVRGNTAPGVLLTSKYTSDLPTLNNLSSSINLVSPEAPLPSPSTMNMSLEHPAGAAQNTALPTAENSEHAARQRTTSAVMPFFTKSTQDTPRQKSETSAPFQTSTYRVQPFSIRPPTATYTAHVTAEITHTVSTEISPTLESVSPNTKSRASSKNSQGGKITGEHLFGNDTQKEVLKKLPEHQKDVFPSTEVSVLLPKTTAALPTSKISPLPFTPISVGGDHSSGFLSLNKSVHYDNGKSGEHLPTAELHSHSSPAASTTEERDVASLKPTVIPIVTPQTDTKITKSKTFRVGRKRGQRRKRPPKTSTSRSLTTGHSTTAVPPGNTAIPAVTTVNSAATPASLTPAKLLPESARAVLVTEMPVPWSLATSDTAQHVPTAAKQTSATPSTQMNIQSVTLPPSGLIPQTPTTTTQTTPLLSKPFSATSTQPTPVRAGSEPTQQIKATTMAGEMEKKVTQENHVAQPTFPGRREPSSGAPAATGTTAPRTQHPAPLPAPAAARPPAPTAEASSPPRGGIRFRQKPPTEGTERGKILAVSTLTVPESSQTATPCVPPWGRDKDNSVKGRSDKRQDQETTTRSPISFHPLSRNHFAKPRIIGGKLAAFTVLANSDAFIPCEAVGNPQPTIQWTKISSGKLHRPLWNLPSVLIL